MPDIQPPVERRVRERSPSTQILQGYERMGHTGRRRLMWIGLVMMAAAGGTGLWSSSGDSPVAWWLFTGLIFLSGLCLVFPQLGLQLIEAVPGAIAKLLPTKMLSRPDRRK